MIGEMIRDLGGEPARSTPCLGYALSEAQAAALEAIDASVDINVAGEPVYRLAERLIGHNKPIVFLTGYTPKALTRGFPARASKPIDESEPAAVLSPTSLGNGELKHSNNSACNAL